MTHSFPTRRSSVLLIFDRAAGLRVGGIGQLAAHDRHRVEGQVVVIGFQEPDAARERQPADGARSEEHTSELQSLMRSQYAVLCLKKKKTNQLAQLKYETN